MNKRAPSVAGVILAAGSSSRLGQDKALLAWRGDTFLGGTMQMLLPETQLIIVVAGSNLKNLAPIVYARGGFIIENPDPDQGQFSSLRIGLQAVLDRGRDAALIALVDRPPASPDTVKELQQAFSTAFLRDKWAVVPEYDGRHGHPIFAGREMIEAFLRASADSTARDVEHAFQEKIEYLPVNDPNVILNINTPDDVARMHASENP